MLRIPLAGVGLANNINLQARRRTHIEEGGNQNESDGIPILA